MCATIVETNVPDPFEVVRAANAVPCDMAGSCKMISFEKETTVQTVKYEPKLPNLCVISKEMMEGK